jgi:hypothetical protein
MTTSPLFNAHQCARKLICTILPRLSSQPIAFFKVLISPSVGDVIVALFTFLSTFFLWFMSRKQ